MKIPKYEIRNTLYQRKNENSPTLKAILKNKNYLSVDNHLHFSCFDTNAILKGIRKLNINKAAQDADIPVKILKGNAEFFAEYKTVQILNKFKL